MAPGLFQPKAALLQGWAFIGFCFAKIAWQFCGLTPTKDDVLSNSFVMPPRVETDQGPERAGGLRGCKRRTQHRAINCLAILIIAVSAVAAERQRQRFEVPTKDSAKAEALANHLAALSRRVDRNEAKLLADCAYATVARLRGEYRMFGTPIFNNFLVYHGIKKRGYCYHWSADLLVALDALKLKTLELHWGESRAGTWMENNCLVVTAKGQPFDRGMILDCWRHFGHLRWNLVPSDQDRYYENTKYARFVRKRAAAKKASGSQHGVAFQRRVMAAGKKSD